MSTAIAIFVKTPTLSPVKTRLAAGIGDAAAQEFYHHSLKAVAETVKALDVTAYWAVAEEDGVGDPLWQDFPNLHTEEGCLGARQHHIYETLLQKHDRVILIGADAPQISTEIVERAVIALDMHDFTIGPARDGGYYLFGGRVSTTLKIWTSVPWSTSMTRERLEAVLPSRPAALPMLTDVDREEDLQYIGDEMPADMNAGQVRLLEWIEERGRCVALHG